MRTFVEHEGRKRKRLERTLELMVPLCVLGLAVAERLFPLRPRRGSGLWHGTKNLGVAGLSAPVVMGLERPLAVACARKVARKRLGLLSLLPLPRCVRVALGVLLLDYSLYWWHRATHLMPGLWRFHRLHHLDGDLTTSTAFRFHAGEMLLSVPVRVLQVRVIGVDEQTLRLWQSLLFASISFHHSNLRLPASLERWLGLVVMTPRLHGVHHSVRAEERNSNWSSGLSMWDVVHGTFRRFGPTQPEIGLE